MEFELAPGRLIGPDHPVFIIAEIGQNHQGNKNRINSNYLFTIHKYIVQLKGWPKVWKSGEGGVRTAPFGSAIPDKTHLILPL